MDLTAEQLKIIELYKDRRISLDEVAEKLHMNMQKVKQILSELKVPIIRFDTHTKVWKIALTIHVVKRFDERTRKLGAPKLDLRAFLRDALFTGTIPESEGILLVESGSISFVLSTFFNDDNLSAQGVNLVAMTFAFEKGKLPPRTARIIEHGK